MENNEKNTLESQENVTKSETTETQAQAQSAIDNLSRDQLVALMNEKLTADKVCAISKEIEEIKSRFDSLTAQLMSNKLEAYRDAHEGSEEGFEKESDGADIDMQTAYSTFKARQGAEQTANAQVRRNIISRLEELQKGDEVTAYSKQFREIMEEWKSAGTVASSDYSELHPKYKQIVDKFFDDLRLNREMREMDQKRNYEAKVKLCEEAEKLVAETSATKTFYRVQDLHNQWKQIGPVPNEVREELWNRFKAATTVINERFHKFVDESKDREKANYEAKLALIAEVQKINVEDLTTAKAVEGAVRKVAELQAKWRTIGIVPKAVNAQVYADFRKVCDVIYDHRRTFFKEQSSTLNANLEEKKRLCEQAEAMQDSTDWKETFDKYVAIQKKWKKIGPVPYKLSDEIWKRFKTACDHFFQNRENHIGSEDKEREANLEKKRALLEELKSATLPQDTDEMFKVLQQYQQRWREIGAIPGKKREVHQEFMDLINKHYDRCASEDASKNLERFRAKMELIKEGADGNTKLNQERNKLIMKLKQVEADVNTLENNIGFLSNSKGATSLKNEVENKIKTAKVNIAQINEKLDIIDQMME